MSRWRRIVRNVLIGIAALIVIAVFAIVVVVRTAWFRNYVRREIISATEDSTGGQRRDRFVRFRCIAFAGHDRQLCDSR